MENAKPDHKAYQKQAEGPHQFGEDTHRFGCSVTDKVGHQSGKQHKTAVQKQDAPVG